MRELSRKFVDDLKNSDGVLRPVFDRVKQDQTLMLAIRDGYINIYYRGGNLLKVQELRNSSYCAFFKVTCCLQTVALLSGRKAAAGLPDWTLTATSCGSTCTAAPAS